ncbi:MAG: heterodisulfide reductase-related iron-sulfur binding cluster [Pseudomonadota bacterium]
MKKPNDNSIDTGLHREIALFGARDMTMCMQCGNCSASCPLSTGSDTFPRTIYRYIQLGLRDKLLASPVPWLCYYCGECNKDCPRGAEPAETMMAARRWLTTQYDWTGLAGKLYLSEAWEIGALSTVALFIILLFVFFHGPVITDHVAVNTFAPVLWIEIGDLLMAAVLTTFLLSNAFRMYRFVMAGTRVPLRLFITQARFFVLHFATQKRWRQCGEDKTRWLRHFILVTGYMTMMTLIIVCIRWFQVDDSSWHFTSIFGYYATAVLLYLTVDMFLSRQRKAVDMHRFSEPTDWLFLILLFFTSLTGILMHLVRLAGLPVTTYVMYVIHLAIAVPMLVIEVPFGKWSHLFYRPLALFLAQVREKALTASLIDAKTVTATVGEAFLECMQCGTCTSLCPVNRIQEYSPRRIMRQIALDTGTVQTLDTAVWDCLTCNACGTNCPRGIDIIEIMKTVRSLNVDKGKTPDPVKTVLKSLETNTNPWNGRPEHRMDWALGLDLPTVEPGHEYCLFTCCTTAYDPVFVKGNQKTAQSLPLLMAGAGISFGTLGVNENCCGDPAHTLGGDGIFTRLRDTNSDLLLTQGVKKVVTTSPHCMNTFKTVYPELTGRVEIEHYTELLDRLLTQGRLKLSRKVEHVVTFHDPCYLGRHNKIYDAPRNILKRIPGMTVVEMPSNRENSLCCGGGGGGAWKNKSTEEPLNVIRVHQALASGADVLATACPFCVRMLSDAVSLLGVGDRIQVRDLADLVAESIEIKKEVRELVHTP